MSLSIQDILFASNDHADYVRRLERAYEQLQTSLETAKKDHKRIREMRKWDDYDKLYKKYLKKCAQLADAKDEYNPFDPNAIDPDNPFAPRKEK